MSRYMVQVPIKIEMHGFLWRDIVSNETDPEEVVDEYGYIENFYSPIATEVEENIRSLFEALGKDNPHHELHLEVVYVTPKFVTQAKCTD
jgi:hypothetical protein